MRPNLCNALTLTAALFVVGCGSDDSSFNYGPFSSSPPVVTAPVAVADSFSTLGNSILTGSVTANDTVNGAVVTTFQNPSDSGGTVAISSSGQLIYVPPANVSGVSDTFTYTLSNSAGSSTATVTVQIGARGFFVKNDVGVTGTGTQSDPFKTLTEAVTAASGVNGAQIVVFRGDGSSTGLNTPVTLGTGQGISSLDPANPATLTGPVTLTNGNRVADLRLLGTVGTAVNGTGAVNGTLTGVTVDNCSTDAILLNNATGTWSLNNCTVANGAIQGCVANCTTGVLNWTVSNCTFTNNTFGDTVVNVTGTASQNVTIQNCVVNQSRRQLLALRGTTGPVGLNVNNCTVNGGGVCLRGLDILTQGTLQLSGRVTSNNITSCTQEAVLLGTEDNSNCRLRFDQNRLLGNLGGFFVGSNFSGNLGLAVTNNTSDTFSFTQTNPSALQVEGLSNLVTTLGNTGTVATAGIVQDVPVGSLGIP